jgi:23S rRNA pseudouridine2605 synthase
MTLDRVLSRYGLFSRRASEDAIRSGRVKVNGRVVRDPAIWTDPRSDTVHLDGKRIRQVRKTYLLFYKPKGVLTSHGDRRGRKTLYDCLDPKLPWVAPVGRLDKDTSGLLLLTNDTEFANFVTSPASEVRKTYLIKANTLVDDTHIRQMSGGFKMNDGQPAKPQSVRRVEDRGKYSWLEIVLTEGKNREIHRLLESAGLKVLKMVRTRIGPCTLEGLQVGQCRHLSKLERTILYSGSAPAPASSAPRGELRNLDIVSRTER